ncbi:MAG: trypsin-like peptidase domain-containing protein [Actinomycetota bacterium]|nr:trypsin-like peptidase domain-containing protein [Actinomycetota bacterium]
MAVVVLASTLVAGLLGGVLGGALGAALTGDEEPPPLARSGVVAPADRSRTASSASGASSIQDIVAKVQPAVVTIRTGSARGGTGTGVILSPDGEVLTNAHVVEGASSIRVLMAGETQARPAKVIGADDTEDLALLRVEGAGGLAPAELGRSADLQVGEGVVAIGNALGLGGSPTVTSGIVSGLNRSVSSINGLIQTDAAINPGNSGGPLVNAAGQVVGINTASAGARGGGAENIGFAITVDRARVVIDRLRKGEKAPPTGHLGVATSEPDDGSAGAQVREVVPGSPAAAAGLALGDVISAVGGEPVAGSGELAAAVRQRRPGDQVDIGYRRGRENRSVRVTLTARPPS